MHVCPKPEEMAGLHHGMTFQPADRDFAHAADGVAGMGDKATAAQSCATYCKDAGYTYMGLAWTNGEANPCTCVYIRYSVVVLTLTTCVHA